MMNICKKYCELMYYFRKSVLYYKIIMLNKLSNLLQGTRITTIVIVAKK